MVYLSHLTDHKTVKNVSKCYISKIVFYLLTSGGKKSNLYLNIGYFLDIYVNLRKICSFMGI